MEHLDSSDTSVSVYDTTEMTHAGDIAHAATLYDATATGIDLDITSTSTSPDLEAAVAADERNKANRFFRPLILICSGLTLGVVVALIASNGIDPEATIALNMKESAVTTVNKVIVNEETPEQIIEKASLPVAPHLEALEEWFEEQPVPVKDRVFLHNAENEVKTIRVRYQTPKKATSSYKGIDEKPVFDAMAQHSDGKYAIGGPDSDIHWQGAWRLNNPSANIAIAEEYVEKVSKQFGEESVQNLDSVTRPKEEFVRHATQGSFGPKLSQ